MEGFTHGRNILIISNIFWCILSSEASTEESPLLEAMFVLKDKNSSDHLTAFCPGTQNDEIDLLISKSQIYLNFWRLASFRPAFPCKINQPCEDKTSLYSKQCSYCSYNTKEKQVVVSISRQSSALVYKCRYLKTNREQLYLIVEETTTETGVYKNVTIAVSCILGCFRLGVLAVLVKRRRAGNYPLVGTNLCWLIKTKTEDSVTPSDDYVYPSQRSRRYTNGDVIDMETCFSEIAAAEAVTGTH